MSEFYSDASKNMREDMNRGADPDRLADMGYEVPEHMLSDKLAADTEQTGYPLDEAEPQAETSRREKAGAAAGQVVCGDCAEVIPCQHVGIGRNGKPYTRGY